MAFYLFALAQMNGVDLDGEIEQKIAKDTRRQYSHDSNGVPFSPVPIQDVIDTLALRCD